MRASASTKPSTTSKSFDSVSPSSVTPPSGFGVTSLSTTK
jgi:hypothetical protein